MANNTLLVKTVKGMERSHVRLVLTKTLVRGGLAPVNEHQFSPANCNDSGTIRSRFRICFDTEKLELYVKKVVGIVSYNSRTLEAGGRSRSRGQVIWISFFNFF